MARWKKLQIRGPVEPSDLSGRKYIVSAISAVPVVFQLKSEQVYMHHRIITLLRFFMIPVLRIR